MLLCDETDYNRTASPTGLVKEREKVRKEEGGGEGKGKVS
jgi:hypothetical protein